jgi:hypothetical protein
VSDTTNVAHLPRTRHRPTDIREIDALMLRAGQIDGAVKVWVADRPLTSDECAKAYEWLCAATPDQTPDRSRVCRDYAVQARRQARAFAACARALLSRSDEALATVSPSPGSGVAETRELLNVTATLVGPLGHKEAANRDAVMLELERIASMFTKAAAAMAAWDDALSDLRSETDGERLFRELGNAESHEGKC